MYLVSNKVASNQAKITVFLHILYNYLRTCHSSLPRFELLKIVFFQEDGKSVKYLENRSEGVQYYPKFKAFDIFFSFHALQNVGKSILSSKLTHFSLNIAR